MTDALLEVSGLKKYFTLPRRKLLEQAPVLKAVDDISFSIHRGETLGLVGESGCGKSTTARLVLRLIKATAGKVLLEGKSILESSPADLIALRREMQIVFQDPLSSLNPRMTIGVAIAESLRFHKIGSRAEQLEQARELLEVVGLSRSHFDRFPHEFSGGQCQRIGIARAIVLKPKLVVLDEPVSSLDVSVQAQILKLLLDLQQEFGLTYLFISHDLSVVKRICNRTAVLYLGKIVEVASSVDLYREPLHPYTQALIRAIPIADPTKRRAADFETLEGDVPSAVDPPKGCRFHTRCPFSMDVCKQREPELREVAPGHQVACFLHDS
jgi:oligopeptide transport system ATP-binding protein